MSKLSQITPILGYTKVSDELFLGRLNAVYSGTNGNPAYPNPPIDMNAFKADIDSYSGVITEALDGSKKAISEKKKKREALTKSLRLPLRRDHVQERHADVSVERIRGRFHDSYSGNAIGSGCDPKSRARQHWRTAGDDEASSSRPLL